MRSVMLSVVLVASMLAGVRASAQDAPALIGAVIDAPLDAPLPSVHDAAEAVGAPQIDPREMARMRTEIRRELAQRRRINLARFEEYVRNEVYPLNSYQPGYVNVFIDNEGHICAAATVMTMDGYGELVQREAALNNFLRLGDVRDGALYEWMLSSGFTQEELATIQEPFYEPEPEVMISPEQQREEEKIRLRARYQAIISQLRNERTASLELATDRLLAHRLDARG